MNKHNESVVNAISMLQKQGKPISNKNVHAITGGSIALVGECVKSWKNAQKAQKPSENVIPEEVKNMTSNLSTFILQFADKTACAHNEQLQAIIKELQSEHVELVDNIKQVEEEKTIISQQLSKSEAEIIELQKLIAVEAAKTKLLLDQKNSEIERLHSEAIELKTERKEMQNLLIMNKK